MEGYNKQQRKKEERRFYIMFGLSVLVAVNNVIIIIGILVMIIPFIFDVIINSERNRKSTFIGAKGLALV